MTAKNRPCTHVYLATDGMFQKIGITGNVKVRMAQLQSSSRGRVELVNSWYRPEDARHIEAAVISQFSYRAVRCREWFDVSCDDIVAAVAKILRACDHYLACKNKTHAERVKWRKMHPLPRKP